MSPTTTKKVTLKVNGVKRDFTVEPGKVLIDLLREDLGLTGTKQSCDRKGQCGACTVIVNGKAMRSCLQKVAGLDGATVTTIEGLGTPEKPHPIQEAFVLTDAIQCGFCTPGMIMQTKALLDQNPDPDVPAIKRALAGNMCRCTGYKKIIEAVQLAGRFLRNETTPAAVRKGLKKEAMGAFHPRPNSMFKACGVAEFSSDIKLKNPLHLALVHSTQHHAKIKSVDYKAALKMPGVAGVMTADDVKGTNRIREYWPDRPVLCEDIVRCLGDPIVAVAAETREQARAAATAVKVEYEPLPVMMTPAEALAPSAYQIHNHSPNLCHTQPLLKGDAKKAFAEAAVVVEHGFETQMNHQAPLEPENCVAYLDGEQLVVIGRSIAIHTHTAEIKEAVGWDNVRYKEPFVGGQFGIKARVTTEAVTAAAALHFKRPIKYQPSMTESMQTTSKRHPYSAKLKLAADRDGQLTALYYDFTINKGAYMLGGPGSSLDRSMMMLQGSYNIPNIEAFGRLVYTNNAGGGAARGAGPPETMFAVESAVDMLAEKMGIDPLEFRKMNSLKPGQAKSTGPKAVDWPFPELCEAVKPAYEKAMKDAKAFNAKGGKLRHGVGLAADSFGIGDFGDKATLHVELDPDDGVTIYAAVADPGEGNDAMLTQIAADRLGIPIDKVRLYTRDTDKTVSAGGSWGSRMTFLAGNALADAIEKLKKAMDEAKTKTYTGLKAAGKPTRYEGHYAAEGADKFDPVTGQGPNYATECHNIQLCEVEVNTETGEARVLKITSAIDAGPVINPPVFEGQLEGGMDQGVGYSLREEYVHGKSVDYVTFKFPMIRDSFEMVNIIRETPRSIGYLKTTGIGEMTMTSTAPAVINAIYDACGARIYDLPATPAKIKKALKA